MSGAESTPSPVPERRGVMLVYLAQFGSQIVSLVTLAILARLVSAEAFGLLGILLPVVMLPRMIASLGFGTAAIQHEQEDSSVLSGLFWQTLGWSAAAAVITAILGLLIAWLFAEPSLASLAAALALGTSLNGISVVPLAILERRMRFAAAAIVRIVSQTIAATLAIGIAVYGGGVWALIAQHVAEIALLAILAWPLSGWWPASARASQLPRATHRFGIYYSLSTVVFYAAQNLDKLVLAAWLGTSTEGRALVGMYSQAYNLMMKPVYVVTVPLSAIMLATLSRLQHDRVKRADWIERFYYWTALVLLPASVGLHLVAPDFMQILAPAWKEAGPILAALAPIIIAQGLINLATFVLAARGRTGLLLFAACIQIFVLAQAVVFPLLILSKLDIAGITSNAAIAVAWSVSTTTIVAILLPFQMLVFNVAEVPIMRFFAAIRFPLITTTLMAAAVLITRKVMAGMDTFPLARLLAEVGVGVLVYAAISYPNVRRTLASPRP